MNPIIKSVSPYFNKKERTSQIIDVDLILFKEGDEDGAFLYFTILEDFDSFLIAIWKIFETEGVRCMIRIQEVFMMMKRTIALCLSALLLMAGGTFAESLTEQDTEVSQPETEMAQNTETHRLETKSFPWYATAVTNKFDGELAVPLWFVDGVDDMPFMDLQDWADFLIFCMTGGGEVPGYELKVEMDDDDGLVSMTREDGYSAIFNFREGRIIYQDYVAFNSMSGSRYMDSVNFPVSGPDGQPFLLSALDSRERYGAITVVNLKEYGIPMIAQDGKHLLPLQTLSTFFMFPLQLGVYFNGEAVFMNSIPTMKDPWEDFEYGLHMNGLLTPEMEEALKSFEGTEEERREHILETVSAASEQGAQVAEQYRQMAAASLYNLYASVPGAERSDALIDYSYRELCLDLDCFYGLKESHNITDFGTFFLQTGLAGGLTSPDASEADAAVSDLTYYWFDDGHSGFGSSSWMADAAPEVNYGFSNQAVSNKGKTAVTVREQYPDAALPYYEVGDTAYVTFDEFQIAPGAAGLVDYYELDESGAELPMDTFGLIINAHRQITRENSPIKNVVLDLSCNGGGAAPAAAYTVCWLLGDAHFSISNTFTGSQATAVYRADVNLDREFDENDTLAGRGLNLYCLVSPSSFSCGNLVPWAFKEDGSVTLLGKATGGGSCIVRYLTTAWGTSFQLSGTNRVAFVKNGSYYDVDRGVDPDHIIDTYEHFYDREALTDYIHSLY